MPIDLVELATGFGIAFVSLMALVFIGNRLGFHIWIWWVSRGKRLTQDSSTKKYWSAHE